MTEDNKPPSSKNVGSDECPWCDGFGKELIEAGQWETDCSNCGGSGSVSEYSDEYWWCSQCGYEAEDCDCRYPVKQYPDSSDNPPNLGSDN